MIENLSFDDLINQISEKFNIPGPQAGCYLVNFDYRFCCYAYGGCPFYTKCKKIAEFNKNENLLK